MKIQITTHELQDLTRLFQTTLNEVAESAIRRLQMDAVDNILKKRLESQSYPIEADANEEGYLTTPITQNEISKIIDASAGKISDINITELGLYNVDVHISETVSANVKVWVVPNSHT